MSMLEYYTKRLTETRGLEHKAALEILRYYLKTVPVNDLIFYINRLNKLQDLRALWEAGLTADLQQAVLRRHTEITIRRQT